jgi:hypothetical protein
MTINISNVAAKAALDAVTALLNAGGAGKLRVYSGVMPADTDTALSGNTVLVDFALNATAFAASTDANPGATAAGNAVTGVSASATGTASFYRLLTNAGVAVSQGTVTATGGGGDLTLTTVSVVSGAPCTVTSMTLTHPE